MMRLGIDATGRPIARQWIQRPLVYLDHWAWMDLADDLPRGKRFVSELKRRGGTLAFSTVNFVECGDVTDIDRLGRMEELMEAALPDLFFLECLPDDTITRLQDTRLGSDDSAVLSSHLLFGAYGALPRNTTDPLSPRLFLRQVRMPGAPAALALARRALEMGWKSAIEKGRELQSAGPAGEKELKRGVSGSPTRLPIDHVWTGASYYDVKSEMNTDNPNHARDFFHMIVPTASCDLVVLDHNGKEKARQIQGELRRKRLLTFESAVVDTLHDAEVWLRSA